MGKGTIFATIAMLLMATANAEHDPVLEWNEIMVERMAEMPPTLHTRLGAMMHLAIFEAVQEIGGQDRFDSRTAGFSSRAAARAAAIVAAHRVLRATIPDSVVELDAARAKSLARIRDGAAKQRGVATGEAAAAAMIASRTGDGSEAAEFHVPDSTDPGVWQPTVGCPPEGGVFLHWRKVTPFALRRADQFRSVPPPAITGLRYARAYEEVKQMGDRNSTTRPQDRTDVARMYAIVGDGILWNPIARQLASAARHSLVENARTFALLNIALADGAIAVTETKYHYDTWRPETAVPAAATDGNDRTEPNTAFQPLLPTPCFPAYPSGHAVLSYAAREVLERIFGPRGHSLVVSSPQLPEVVLKYDTFEEMTTDIDDSRVYGGIHFRFDQTAGAEQGRRVGAWVLRRGLPPHCRCD
jgi:hypothetical protein